MSRKILIYLLSLFWVGLLSAEQDITPPATITDLRSWVMSSSQTQITWSMPGDDDLVGDTYGRQFIYLSTVPSAAINMMTLVAVQGVVVSSKVVGEFYLTGLQPATQYFARVVIADEEHNTSGPSNQVSFITWPVSPAQASTLKFSQELFHVNKSAAFVAVVVQRPSGVGPVGVDYVTENGSALAGMDYRFTEGTLFWPAGDFSGRTVKIPLFNDSAVKSLKVFHVILRNLQGLATYPGGNSARVAIAADDNSVATMMASAGPDQVLVDREHVVLNGSQSILAGPAPYQFVWREVGLVLRSGTATSPADLIVEKVMINGFGTHLITLDIKNATGTVVSDTMVVDIKPLARPPYTPPGRGGFPEHPILSKALAEKYLFHPANGEQGVVVFGLSQTSDIRVMMYDRRGDEVAELLNGTLVAGKHRIFWNGRDRLGSMVAPGAYLGRVTVGKQVQMFKLVVSN